ncbi:hypothetical protein OPV22_001227 [Ensete ventricosum]|uniref:Uncharacterized protein n=1 Tax=Ensete ventricosum TaxID=4639 RepID=A0AAV8RW43_ENSVE|nr:hypothetical protein OPV22_001227 [Ensete ventricosum]
MEEGMMHEVTNACCTVPSHCVCFPQHRSEATTSQAMTALLFLYPLLLLHPPRVRGRIRRRYGLQPVFIFLGSALLAFSLHPYHGLLLLLTAKGLHFGGERRTNITLL